MSDIPLVTEEKEFCEFIENKLKNKYYVHVYSLPHQKKYVVNLYKTNMSCCQSPKFQVLIDFLSIKHITALTIVNAVLKVTIGEGKRADAIYIDEEYSHE